MGNEHAHDATTPPHTPERTPKRGTTPATSQKGLRRPSVNTMAAVTRDPRTVAVTHAPDTHQPLYRPPVTVDCETPGAIA